MLWEVSHFKDQGKHCKNELKVSNKINIEAINTTYKTSYI